MEAMLAWIWMDGGYVYMFFAPLEMKGVEDEDEEEEEIKLHSLMLA